MMAFNQLPKPPQPPPLFTGTPTSIIKDAKALIKHSQMLQDEIWHSIHPDQATFATVLLPLAHIENNFILHSQILTFYSDVSPDPKLRDASSSARRLLDEFTINSQMKENLFKLVSAVVEKNENLEPESQQFLIRVHRDYVKNGMGLPAGEKRERFKEIKERLSLVTGEFRRNMNEGDEGMWFTARELEGVEDDFLGGLEKGSDENEGMLRIAFSNSHVMTALSYAKSGETRKRIYMEQNKCNINVPLFKEAMVLRQEAAELLGYPNHAAFSIEDKMAKTPEIVNTFLSDLRSRLNLGGKKEVEKLKQLKKADLEARGDSFASENLFLWDRIFYSRLMLEKEYSVDQQKIAEYFPLETTIKGMLEIFQNLFGLVFEELTGSARNELADSGNGSDVVWHEDVQIFSVWDNEQQGSGFLGYLDFDLFDREGKYKNPSSFNLHPGFLEEDGTRHFPATALLCGFSKPTKKKPSLLKHDDVVMLFHELGHGIHDLVAKTAYARFHGTQTVIDFGEAPSQMLENWCWTPSVLISLSRHYSSLSSDYQESWAETAESKYKPPEQIPDKMIESLVRAKNVNGALLNLFTLHFAIFDMAVHQPKSYDECKNINIAATWNILRKEVLPLDGPEVLGADDDWGHGYAKIPHFMGSYDAGFYSYAFSKVFSTDMFYSVFKDDPMNAKEGLRYRYAVLEKGGSQDEMRTLRDFLGRDPKTDSFYMDLGLS